MSTPENTNDSNPPSNKPPLSSSRIVVGSLLGALIGLAPSPDVAPGLWISLMVGVLLFRTPFALTVVMIGASKAISLFSAGIAFEVGRLLLDGPLQGLFRAALDTPFLALFGLEYYLVSGGLFLALVFAGAVAAALILKRRSQGGAPKSKGAIRPVGFLFAALLLGGLFAVQSTAAEGMLTTAASKTLSAANGSTVDVSGVELDIAEATFGITDVAFSNPRALNTDVFRGIELKADLSSADLLTKRLHIEKLIIRRAKSGTDRAVPGVLVGAQPEPEVEEPEGGERSIEDYLKDWEVWRDRLGQAREWLEEMAEDQDTAGRENETEEERIEREADESGYASVVAKHLFTDAPSLWIDELAIEGFEFSWLPGESFALNASNLSTQPSLLDSPMSLSFASAGDLFQLALSLPSSRLGQAGELDFAVRGIPLSSLTGMLKLGAGSSLSGGSIDISLKGPWSGGKAGYIDLPLDVSLNDFELALGGSKKFPVTNLKLPIHLRGPIDRPNVRIDTEGLTQSLLDAGLSELVNYVEAERDRLVGDGKAKLQDELDKEVTGKLGDLLGVELDISVDEILGGNLEQTQEQVEAAAKAKLEEEARGAAAAELQKLLGDDAASMKDVLENGTKADIQKALKDLATEKAKEQGGEVLKDKLGDKLKGLGGLFGGKKP